MKAELLKELNGDLDIDPAVAETLIQRTIEKAMKICDTYYFQAPPAQRIIKHELEALLK